MKLRGEPPIAPVVGGGMLTVEELFSDRRMKNISWIHWLFAIFITTRKMQSVIGRKASPLRPIWQQSLLRLEVTIILLLSRAPPNNHLSRPGAKPGCSSRE